MASLWQASRTTASKVYCSIQNSKPLVRPLATHSRNLATQRQQDDNDIITHTGQKWDKDDYRLIRFTDTLKQINKNFAIDLIAEIPPETCTTSVVSCNGGGGPLGHPKVYINLDQPSNHSCGYCGLRFVLDHDHKH